MDFKLKMNVLNLKKLALEQVIEAKNEDNDSIIKYIDEIIGSLAYFKELFSKVEEEIKELDEMSYYEFDINCFEINSQLNYDYSLIENIYNILFEEILDQQRVLIGVIVSDFYEYHKLNCDMYTKEDNEDILKTLNIIENSSYDDMICLFNQDYKLAFFMIDSFLYYNLNYTPKERLINRNVLKVKGMFDVLKTHNKFINDSLNDETIYNTFITTLPDLIRKATDSISLQFQIFIEYEDTCELLFKYFTTDYIPDDIFGIIPPELSNINIKQLKKLQLDFILSDFLTRELNRNKNNIYKVLEYTPKQIRNIFINNSNTLKSILKDYIENGDIDDINDINENKINICKDDMQKIYKVNGLTRLDI